MRWRSNGAVLAHAARYARVPPPNVFRCLSITVGALGSPQATVSNVTARHDVRYPWLEVSGDPGRLLVIIHAPRPHVP